MAVEDYGIEVLKKAAEEVTPGDKSDYFLKTRVTNPITDPVRVSETLPNINYIAAVLTVGTSEIEAKVGASRLTDRKTLVIFNDSTDTVHFGPSGVTTSGAGKGIPLEAQEQASFSIGDNIGIFLISTGASSNVIVQELS